MCLTIIPFLLTPIPHLLVTFSHPNSITLILRLSSPSLSFLSTFLLLRPLHPVTLNSPPLSPHPTTPFPHSFLFSIRIHSIRHNRKETNRQTSNSSISIGTWSHRKRHLQRPSSANIILPPLSEHLHFLRLSRLSRNIIIRNEQRNKYE